VLPTETPEVEPDPPGTDPYDVGGRHVCPDSTGFAAYLPEHVFYPPNHPGRPPQELRPASCFSSAAEAVGAGYSLAPPPPGVQVMGGIYLVRANAFPLCDLAGAALGFPVPCPTRLPSAGLESATPACAVASSRTGCVLGGVFALEYAGFALPPGAVSGVVPLFAHHFAPGIEAPHLVLSAFEWTDPSLDRTLAEALYCHDGERVGEWTTGLANGARMRGEVVDCPHQLRPNGGHRVLRWSRNGVSYQLSVHGHTDRNMSVLVAVASNLFLTG
jgi:hypothetical protein